MSTMRGGRVFEGRLSDSSSPNVLHSYKRFARLMPLADGLP